MADRPEPEAPYEALLEESADDLYENAPCGYYSTRADGTLVKVNETFLAWTGYTREDLVGSKRIHDLLPAGDRIYYETHYAPLLRMQGAVRELAVEIVCADGHRFPVLVNSVLKTDEDGTPLVIRTSVFDARDRRQYERELLRARQEAEERARAALALAHVNHGVLLVDAEGRIQVVNPACEEILGVTAESATGRTVGDVLPAWAAIAEKIPIGAPDRWPTPATLPYSRGGSEAWIAVAGVNSGDGVTYTIRDVSDDRQLEELRSDLIAVVSHELRTPLAGIYGAAQTLLSQAESLDRPVRDQLLELIAEQSERQRRVLDDILLTSRLDRGAVEVADGVFDGDAVVSAVSRAFAGTPASKDRIEVESAGAVSVRGDAALTEQVLVSLADNALKYAPPESPVRVDVRVHDRWGRFTVSDDGPGIPAGAGERIFEKFFRLDPSQRSGVPGVGLGLYIAKELVGRMHGRIGLLPAERGATFYVDLPLDER